MGSADTGYQLGSDASELERLDLQGRVLAPATRTILETAGLARGMRVLDLGAGAGDVSFVATELVGSNGEVVGIDQSPDSLAKATARADQRGLSNVRFVVGDIHDPAPDGPYDAIIGRLVLMYVSDPAAVLRRQASLLRSGGVVVPIEFDLHSARSLPSTPLVTQALSWLVEAFAAAHIDPALGPRLWAVADYASAPANRSWRAAHVRLSPFANDPHHLAPLPYGWGHVASALEDDCRPAPGRGFSSCPVPTRHTTAQSTNAQGTAQPDALRGVSAPVKCGAAGVREVGDATLSQTAPPG